MTRLVTVGLGTLAAVALVSLRSDVRAGEPTNPAAAVAKSHIMTTPAEVTWGDCSAALPAGARCATIEGDREAPDVLFTFRVRMPDGYRIAPHFHPADEHLTVISGSFNMGLGKTFDPKALRPMGAGSFMVMPKGHAHYAMTSGETVVQVHAIGPWGITYVNPADDPRTK